MKEVQELLAWSFLVATKLAVLWATVTYGLGITPRSWTVCLCCVFASGTLTAIARAMKEDA